MTERPWSRLSRRLALSAVTAFCLWRSAETAASYFLSDDAYSYQSAWRSAARSAPHGSLALACGNRDCINPVERSRLIAMSWERLPRPLVTIDESCGPGSVPHVLTSKWHPLSLGERLRSAGFAVVATNEYVKTWSRAGDRLTGSASGYGEVSAVREVVALVAELGLMVFALGLLLGPLRSLSPRCLTVPVVLVVVLGAITLSHPLSAPNGLGTYGGKAKLVYCCGRECVDILKGAAGDVLQPSYPPGLTLLACLHFVLSGGCGDRLVQMTVVFAVALLGLALTRRSGGLRNTLPVLLFCLSPIAIRLTSGFYAEPFAALMLVLGWNAVREGRPFVGALVMGMAGLFRLEAVIVALVFALGTCVYDAGCRTNPMFAAVAVVPSSVWLVLCRLLGFGTLADWDFGQIPRLGQIASAARIGIDAFVTTTAPVMITACLSGAARRFRLHLVDVGFLGPMSLALTVVVVVCGYYTSPYADWMMSNTIPRLVWYVSAVPVFEFVRRTGDVPACGRK